MAVEREAHVAAICGGREGFATTAVHPRGLARVCATCVSQPRYLVCGGPTGVEKRAHVAAMLRHGSKFVSDYRTRPGILAEQAPPSKAHFFFLFFLQNPPHPKLNI